MVRRFLLFMPFMVTLLSLAAQKPVTIKLDNASFEDFPQIARTPNGWVDCGFPGESPPDVQPGAFDVNKPAQQGGTYLGLVVRDVSTWESVGQRLKSPLLKGVTYTFSIYLCRSELYMSQSQMTKKMVNYTTPVILRVWGGSGTCQKDEMLAESDPVSNTSWQRYSFKFTPKENQTHLVLEAFYKVPTIFPYNGNLLLDNASEIVPERKPEPKKPDPVVAKVEPKKDPNPKKVEPKKPDPVVNRAEPNTEPAQVNTPTVTEAKFKQGQVIKIEKLQFEPNSSTISKESFPSLDAIKDFLATNANLVVEIGGHTNTIPQDDNYCIRLSTERAKSVAEYLVNKGIERSRLVIKGYGKSAPISKENTAAAHKINQRVELKILSVNG